MFAISILTFIKDLCIEFSILIYKLIVGNVEYRKLNLVHAVTIGKIRCLPANNWSTLCFPIQYANVSKLAYPIHSTQWSWNQVHTTQKNQQLNKVIIFNKSPKITLWRWLLTRYDASSLSSSWKSSVPVPWRRPKKVQINVFPVKKLQVIQNSLLKFMPGASVLFQYDLAHELFGRWKTWKKH